jgi:hypothetical protein
MDNADLRLCIGALRLLEVVHHERAAMTKARKAFVECPSFSIQQHVHVLRMLDQSLQDLEATEQRIMQALSAGESTRLGGLI